jgi:hypothetical protein
MHDSVTGFNVKIGVQVQMKYKSSDVIVKFQIIAITESRCLSVGKCVHSVTNLA